MNTFYSDATTTVFAGDSLEALRTLPDNSIDAVITDPPYGLADLPAKKVGETIARWISGELDYIPAGRGFMGAAWDRFVPPPALWAECLRVLKPGGYLASFAGARTQDLMGMSIRLSGFQIKDQLQWLRSDSFNKSKFVLSAGYEPIILAQKPLEGTIAQNMAKWGTGGIDAESCRTPYRNAADEAESKGKNQHGKYGTVHGGNAVYGDFSAGGVRTDYDAPGRWPKNLALDEASAELLDALNPSSKSRAGKPNRPSESGNGWRTTTGGQEHNDEGGPSRFYPVFEEDPVPFHYAGRATVKERPVVDGVSHTTVKPLSVMDWLIRLLTPAGGTVLDPFLGSGTTAEAARLAGFNVVGAEGHEPYLELIAERIRRSAA